MSTSLVPSRGKFLHVCWIQLRAIWCPCPQSGVMEGETSGSHSDTELQAPQSMADVP